METGSTQPKKPAAKPPKLSRAVQARLAQQLRAAYDEIAGQGVPSRFSDMIDRVESKG